jgi:hypothetical protein
VVIAARPTWMRVSADGPVRATVIEVNPVTGTITVAFGAGPRSDRVEIATAGFAHRRGDEVAFRIEEVALFDPVTGNHLP